MEPIRTGRNTIFSANFEIRVIPQSSTTTCLIFLDIFILKFPTLFLLRESILSRFLAEMTKLFSVVWMGPSQTCFMYRYY